MKKSRNTGFDSAAPAEPGRFTGAQLETIDEIRDDVLPLSYMFAGYRAQEWSRKWQTAAGYGYVCRELRRGSGWL